MVRQARFAYALMSTDVGVERFPTDYLPARGERIPFTYAGTTEHLTIVEAARVSDHEIALVLEARADHPYIRGLRKTGRSERGV